MTPKITREGLALVAATLRFAAGSRRPKVDLWCPPADLAAVNGATTKSVCYFDDADEKEPYVIDSVTVVVEGVCFKTQESRPATAAELATASSSSREHSTSYSTGSV